MHWLKKNSLVTALCLLFPLCALSADEDGTFTITIQGPDTEQATPVNRTRRAAPQRQRQTVATQTPAAAAAQAAQRRATANVQQNTTIRNVQRVQNLPATTPNQANTAPVNTPANTNASINYRTYAIKSGDTIWSIASSFIPEDKSVNEFQIIASIYRNNPNAFANSNVNNLLKTTIKVPDNNEIAREDQKVGGRLLKQGSIVMPPLKAITNTNEQIRNNNNQYVSSEKRTDSSDNQATVLTGKDLNKNDVSGDEDIPSYTAMEAKVRELQEKKEQEELNRVIPAEGSKQDQVKQDSLDKLEFANGANDIDGTKQKTVTEQVKNPPIIVQTSNGHQQALDVDTIRIMLDGNKTALEEKTRAIEVQMAEVMDRVKKTSAATAKTAADSVATLANQYDHIIANIQQDIIEIKGSLTKLTQDNERIREMVLANDEKLEDMMLQISNYTVNASDSGVDINRPIMFILFGTGFLSIVLLIIFFIFKKQNRERAYTLGDDFDVEDSSSENMLLTDENSVFEFDAPLGDDDDDSSEDQKATTENSNAIDAPSGDVKLPENASENLDNASDTDTSANENQSAEDNAQKAWDEAANTEATDDTKNNKDVMDDWSQALSEQQNSEQSTVDVDNNSDDMSAWNEALKEQSGDKTDDSQVSDGNDLSAWDEALKEQSGDKTDDSQVSDGNDLSAWDEALKEQSGEQKDANDDSKEDSSSDLSARDEALKEQSGQEKDPDQTEADEEISDENSKDDNQGSQDESVGVSDDLAAWDEALNTQHLDNQENKFSENRVIPDETENLDSMFPDEDSKQKNVLSKSSAKHSENMSEADAIAAAMANAMNAKSLDDTKSPDLSNVQDDDKLTEQVQSDAVDRTSDSAEIADVEEVTAVDESSVSDDTDGENISEVTPEDTDLSENTDAQIDELNEALAKENSVDEPSSKIDESADDLSDEEKSLLDSLNKADTTDKSAIPSDEEAVQIAESEVLTNAQHDVQKGVGSNVDTVLDDDLDLESLLDENGNEKIDDSINAKDNDVIAQSEIESESEPESVSDEITQDTSVASSDQNDEQSLDVENTQDTQITDAMTDSTDTDLTEIEEQSENSDTQDETVSWSVPEGEDEIVENEMNHSLDETENTDTDASVQTADEQSDEALEQNIDESSDPELQGTMDDLKDLEARIGSAGSMYDPEADNDIMNMLSQNSDGDSSTKDDSFSSDDITTMLQSASKSTPDISSRIDDIKSSVTEDANIANVAETDNVLEQVFDRIGPITAIDDEPYSSLSNSSAKELTPKEHQYYVDELNLARLYFETGDTEEAIKIIDDVKEHGSDDLKQEALKIIESYGN